MIASENLQRHHYNTIATDYEKHYDDRYSQKYRDIFVRRPLFAGIDLRNKTVLEGMCGSGQSTAFLLDGGARVIGLDLSEKMIESFKKRWPGCEAIYASITATALPDASLDGVVVMGGLHHLHPNLGEAIEEIYRILKPGGFFCFFEPHASSWFDRFRRSWYQKDRKMFAENERSIDVGAMKEQFGDKFRFDLERYGGNLAYLLIYNSLIFRVPLFLKAIYSWPLLGLEKLISPLIGKRTGLYVVGRWWKK